MDNQDVWYDKERLLLDADTLLLRTSRWKVLRFEITAFPRVSGKSSMDS
ncbi:MAG: hypothetical protein PHV32_02790 [Eubacteriales bacterium]|nr:hypothetical protein [Eubacteriales bacterium]